MYILIYIYIYIYNSIIIIIELGDAGNYGVAETRLTQIHMYD